MAQNILNDVMGPVQMHSEQMHRTGPEYQWHKFVILEVKWGFFICILFLINFIFNRLDR